MNYEAIYWDIIRKGIARKTQFSKTYLKKQFEFHHAIPKSRGGKNDDWNLIPLTMKEHAVAHLVCRKAFGGKDMTVSKNTSIRTFCRTRAFGYAFSQDKKIWKRISSEFSTNEVKVLQYIKSAMTQASNSKANLAHSIAKYLIVNNLITV